MIIISLQIGIIKISSVWWLADVLMLAPHLTGLNLCINGEPLQACGLQWLPIDSELWLHRGARKRKTFNSKSQDQSRTWRKKVQHTFFNLWKIIFPCILEKNFESEKVLKIHQRWLIGSFGKIWNFFFFWKSEKSRKYKFLFFLSIFGIFSKGTKKLLRTQLVILKKKNEHFQEKNVFLKGVPKNSCFALGNFQKAWFNSNKAMWVEPRSSEDVHVQH
jgi:hypothetical protein